MSRRLLFKSRYKDLAEEYRYGDVTLEVKDADNRTRAAPNKNHGQSSRGANNVNRNRALEPERSTRPDSRPVFRKLPMAVFLSNIATKDKHGKRNVQSESGKKNQPSTSHQPPMMNSGSISDQKQQLASLDRKPLLDVTLKDAVLINKSQSSTYNFFLDCRKKLPIYQMKQVLIDKINGNKVVIIAGPPGCGKTTQVPQFILDDFIMREEGSLCHVACALNHRLHVKSAAMRVATERDESVGTFTVGYKVGNDRAIPPPAGSILFCTIRSLLDSLYNNPSFSGISHIILDGVHERDTSIDILISLLRDLLPQCGLKLIIMSATLNCEEFSGFFDSCPIINIPSCSYAIQDFYLEDIIETLSFRDFPEFLRSNKREQKAANDYASKIGPYIRTLENTFSYSKNCIDTLKNFHSEDFNVSLIIKLLKYICREKPYGAILVFLKSAAQISQLQGCLNAKKYFKSSGFLILPLHSKLEASDQEKVFLQQPPSVRKIILTTNIAETSITFEDVVYVVDCGKMAVPTSKIVGRDRHPMPMECWVSSANAEQRRGRVGRVRHGTCFKLYTRGRERIFDMHPVPQILKCPVDLESLIPLLKKIKGDKKDAIVSFLEGLMNPPDSIVMKRFIIKFDSS